MPMPTPFEYDRSINAHYGRAGLSAFLLASLRENGTDVDHLVVDDLSSVDHFHTRGRDSTLELASLAAVHSGMRVLDVGGGIGGAARLLAANYGARVTVLDIAEEYCIAGEDLTARTGLADRVTFRCGSALDLPFPAGGFDLVWTQHSTMNIPDKARLYAEAHRVLVPGGRLAMHEIIAGPVQPIHFPVPWAPDTSINFLQDEDTLREALGSAWFRMLSWSDVTETSLAWFRERVSPRPDWEPPKLGLHLLLRDAFRPAFENQVRNLEEMRVIVVMAHLEAAHGAC